MTNFLKKFKTSKLSSVLTILKIFLAFLFLLQPLVVYLSSYDPGDCDDKAVHYYSAAYWQVPKEQKSKFLQDIEPFVEKYKNNPSWDRTAFRLSSANAYPLANLAISAFEKPGQHFTHAVNNGLFAVTIVAILVIVIIASRTPFGFWQTILVLNLVAFYSIKLHFLVAQVPRNMHPFIAYVPRGAAALMVIPIVLSFAAGTWQLFLISIFLMLFWHVGIGLVNIFLAVISVAIYVLLTKYKLLSKNYIFLVFLLGIAGGINSLISMAVLGLVFFLYSRKIKPDLKDFYHRAFLFGFVLFFTTKLVFTATSISKVNLLIGSILHEETFKELPLRLTGILYTLLVLLVVIAIRLIHVYIFKHYLAYKKSLNIPSSTVIIAILIILFLNHLPEYTWVARRATGYFFETCREVKTLDLPKDVTSLSIGNESQLFSSLGQYLFYLERH